MYSSEDFENFYVRYRAEALPKGISIQTWCIRNNVSWNLFNKWYRDTRHRIVPVSVNGKPEDSCGEDPAETSDGKKACLKDSDSDVPVRILVDIRMTNGMHIRQKNLSYGKLRKLVEKLEALC